MQQYALDAALGQECSTLSANSKTPSCQQWVTNTSHSKPSGCNMSAQLALPFCFVIGAIICLVTVAIEGPTTRSEWSNGSSGVLEMVPRRMARTTSFRNLRTSWYVTHHRSGGTCLCNAGPSRTGTRGKALGKSPQQFWNTSQPHRSG
eukprot:CAMPEP_0198508604 /NCGR_PEP_ID=MMETSP1462-20131121/13064_1 /TAXON_ID=1333877 /ORGANISM="Brandtodinium nutriculum, Strain RCC3387" /LENGTH=147 /DNA_ID=CAMNT_0044237893 /DNA_START=29 /DNA_END=469 /DNA_ORIENTATION=+